MERRPPLVQIVYLTQLHPLAVAQAQLPEMDNLVARVAALVVQEATLQQLVAQAIVRPHLHRKVIMVVIVQQLVAGKKAVAVVVVQVLLVQMAQVQLMAVLAVLVLHLQ